MKKLPVILLILIIIIAVIIASVISIYLYKEPVKQGTISSGTKYKQTWSQSTLDNLQVNENVIGYIFD